MITRHGSVDCHPRFAGLGYLYFGMSKNTVSHVKPAVRSPRETVEQLVPIISAKTREQHLARVRDVIMVCVLEKQKVRRLSDIDAAVAQQKSCGEIKSIGKHCHFIGAPIAIG